MASRLCPFCMQMTDAEVCPHCGKNTNYTGTSLHLPAGYVVHGKHPYVLGAALGQGGFGITYVALDMVTQERVAIKEYFPTYCAGRTADHAVTAYPNQEDVFQKGKARFLDEARLLKSLSDLKSIVNVLDFFGFNNSAYLVMEFLEGDSLKSHAQKHGKFPAQDFLGKLRPLMEDIDRMHHRGVVHRDIAPDNIILMPDGQMKLIDFGAARSFVGDKSMTVVVKKGFAPIEQYMRKGSSAYTDVYALAATIYYCITGTVPPDSAERAYEGALLKDPVALGADLSLSQKKAIEQALEVQPTKRTQSIFEFAKALGCTSKPENPKPIKEVEKPKPVKEAEKPKPIKEAEKPKPVKKEAEEPKADPKKKPQWFLPAIAAVLLCIVGAVLFMGKESPAVPKQTEPPQLAAPETTVPETTIPVTEPEETNASESTVPETEPPIILSEAQKYNEAVDFFNNGEYGKAAIAFGKLGDYRNSKEVSRKIWDAKIGGKTICTVKHNEAAVGMKEDGTVWAVGDGNAGCNDLFDWTDIVTIGGGNFHIVGLKADGTVLAVGRNALGQCDVSDWIDIVDIFVGYDHTVGLKADGTVLVAGEYSFVECNVSDWKNIVDVAVGDDYTIGLKTNGKVLAEGDNWAGQCDVSRWKGIVDVAVGYDYTVGLKSDGTVLAVGKNDEGQCNVSDWKDIVDIAVGYSFTVGLKSDGTVVAVGDNNIGQCNVLDWTDIVDVAAGQSHTVGLKADGTVLLAGNDCGGQANVSNWTDIVDIVTGSHHTVGLKADGTVLAVGWNRKGECNTFAWKNIRLPAYRDALLAAIDLDYITEE